MYGIVDCNNFFVSCERLFNPSLNGRPVVVLSGNDGCVIARSNEAKALGIPMGCPTFQIKDYTDLRPIVMLSARHTLYRDLSLRVMSVVGSMVEQMQVYSVDESFFKMPFDDVEHNHATMALMVKRIAREVGIPVSVGFAPSRTLAKIASHIAKKDRRITDGVYWLVRPEAIDIILRRTPIGDVWGIGRRLKASLETHGVLTAADFVAIPTEVVRANFGITVERTQRELKGEDCVTITPVDAAHKSMMQSRTFGKVITSRHEVQDAIVAFAEHLARQLREEHMVANRVSVFLRGDRYREDLPFYANSCELTMPVSTSSAIPLMQYALQGLNNIYREGFGYRKAGVMVSELTPDRGIQLDLFEQRVSDEARHRRLMAGIDSINNTYGAYRVQLAPQYTAGEWRPHHTHDGWSSQTLHFFSGMMTNRRPHRRK